MLSAMIGDGILVGVWYVLYLYCKIINVTHCNKPFDRYFIVYMVCMYQCAPSLTERC